jgi:hypothetical protein
VTSRIKQLSHSQPFKQTEPLPLLVLLALQAVEQLACPKQVKPQEVEPQAKPQEAAINPLLVQGTQENSARIKY